MAENLYNIFCVVYTTFITYWLSTMIWYNIVEYEIIVFKVLILGQRLVLFFIFCYPLKFCFYGRTLGHKSYKKLLKFGRKYQKNILEKCVRMYNVFLNPLFIRVCEDCKINDCITLFINVNTSVFANTL